MKRRIAVLGGGVGAMTTAFHLTNEPGWQDEYEITVYQLGWRIGGKGASGRNLDVANRIEEHGLHIWMGFYENAFRMMDGAYRECAAKGLTPNTPFTSLLEAFSPMNLIVLTEKLGDEEWDPWFMNWPPNAQRPGLDAPPPAPSMVEFSLKLLEALLENVGHVLELPAAFDTALHGLVGFVEHAGARSRLLDAVAEAVPGVVREVERKLHLPAVAKFLESTGVRVARDLTGDREEEARAAGRVLSGLHAEVGRLLESKTQDVEGLRAIFEQVDRFVPLLLRAAQAFLGGDERVRRALLVIDTARTIVAGILADNLLDGDFDRINDLDFIEWMQKHGSIYHDTTVLTSGFYDSSFAYEDGNPTRAGMNFAAGSVLNGCVRLMFTYRGSIMWRMEAGMGDTVFTPIYLALKNRGVRFEFFRKVTNLGLSPGKDLIDTIDMDVQATVKNGEYDPLFDVPTVLPDGQTRQIKCWPDRPLFDQLAEGEDLRRGVQIRNGRPENVVNPNLESWWSDWQPVDRQTLRRGQDFDDVVLGISLGALPHISKELIAGGDTPRSSPNFDARARWRDMLEKVKVVRTQALQLWLNRTPSEMGWRSSEPPLLCAYVEPFDTWCEMSHLICRENWKPEDNVKQIAYFCNTAPSDPAQAPFTDPTYPQRELDKTRRDCAGFLRRYARLMWPDCMDKANPEEFDWKQLVNRDGASGPAALDSQWVRVNIDPSELYVLAVKGSSKYRLWPGKSGFGNLYLAGDWTKNFIEIGCVEAAVISGMLAASAVMGKPLTIFGAFGTDIEKAGAAHA